jgi:cytochrome oxidase Cu insertion factor (SCO1/SenC/PrrC family)
MTGRRVVATLGAIIVAAAAYAGGSDQGTKFDQFRTTAPLVGDRAPDFTLTALDGRAFSLAAAVARQPVVLEFGSFT